jgi:hypothetical protein
MNGGEIARRLREGRPSIELTPDDGERDVVEVSSWTLQPGEAEIVARRLREILAGS